jgi:hypothetical protein
MYFAFSVWRFALRHVILMAFRSRLNLAHGGKAL